MLRRAIQSVLLQDADLELIVSDNASEDDTPAVCRGVVDSDDRVQYVRQPQVLRPSQNFMQVLGQARGQYFMWLADDDWLGDAYLRTCRAVLETRRDLVGIVGRTVYHGPDGRVAEGEPVCFSAATPEQRILAYLRDVRGNAGFYGLFRRQSLSGIELEDAFAADWLYMVALLLRGGLECVDTVVLNRSIDGQSSDLPQLLASYGWKGLKARFPWPVLGALIAYEIAWRDASFAVLGHQRRSVLAWKAYRIVSNKRGSSTLSRLRARLQLRGRLRRVARSVLKPVRRR